MSAKEMFLGSLAIIFLGVFVTGLILIPTRFFESVGCHARWQDRPTQFGFFSGCLVQTGGKFVPEDRIWFERNQ